MSSQFIPNYQAVENLAVFDAALEASQRASQQPLTELEALTSQFYPLHLKKLCEKNPSWFVVKTKAGHPDWTFQRSGSTRAAAGRLFDRYKASVKLTIVNVILPILKKKLNDDNTIPSGKNAETILHEVKEELWIQEWNKTNKRRAAQSTNGGSGDAGGASSNPPTTAEPPAMPDSFDGGGFFLTFAERGPLSASPRSVLSLSPPEASSRKRPVRSSSSSMPEGEDAVDGEVDTSRRMQRQRQAVQGTAKRKPMETQARSSLQNQGQEDGGSFKAAAAILAEHETQALSVQHFSALTQARKDKVLCPAPHI